MKCTHGELPWSTALCTLVQRVEQSARHCDTNWGTCRSPDGRHSHSVSVCQASNHEGEHIGWMSVGSMRFAHPLHKVMCKHCGVAFAQSPTCGAC